MPTPLVSCAAVLLSTLCQEASPTGSIKLDPNLLWNPLESVQLPVAEHAVPDTWRLDLLRPILNFRKNGTVLSVEGMAYSYDQGIWLVGEMGSGRPTLEDLEGNSISVGEYALNKPDELRSRLVKELHKEPIARPTEQAWKLAVQRQLAEFAKEMEQRPLHEDGSGPRVPSDPLVLRADDGTSFGFVGSTIRWCGLVGIEIQDVHLAVAPRPEGPEQDALHVESDSLTHLIPLPLLGSPRSRTEAGYKEWATVQINLDEAGQTATYSIGVASYGNLAELAADLKRMQRKAMTWVELDIPDGATYGDAVRLLSTLRGAGCLGYSLKGALFPGIQEVR